MSERRLSGNDLRRALALQRVRKQVVVLLSQVEGVVCTQLGVESALTKAAEAALRPMFQYSTVPTARIAADEPRELIADWIHEQLEPCLSQGQELLLALGGFEQLLWLQVHVPAGGGWTRRLWHLLTTRELYCMPPGGGTVVAITEEEDEYHAYSTICPAASTGGSPG